jgi:hypothetical protein
MHASQRSIKRNIPVRTYVNRDEELARTLAGRTRERRLGRSKNNVYDVRLMRKLIN